MTTLPSFSSSTIVLSSARDVPGAMDVAAPISIRPRKRVRSSFIVLLRSLELLRRTCPHPNPLPVGERGRRSAAEPSSSVLLPLPSGERVRVRPTASPHRLLEILVELVEEVGRGHPRLVRADQQGQILGHGTGLDGV